MTIPNLPRIAPTIPAAFQRGVHVAWAIAVLKVYGSARFELNSAVISSTCQIVSFVVREALTINRVNPENAIHRSNLVACDEENMRLSVFHEGYM